MSLCSFHAGRCHGDPLFFISEGVCDPDSVAKVEWAKFRAQMSSKSPVQERCGLDTCYQWETCSGEKSVCLLDDSCLFSDVSGTGSCRTWRAFSPSGQSAGGRWRTPLCACGQPRFTLLFHITMVIVVLSILCLLSASQKCECKAARTCVRDEQHMFCIRLSRSPRARSMDLCSMAALKCANYEFEILSESVCESR